MKKFDKITQHPHALTDTPSMPRNAVPPPLPSALTLSRIERDLTDDLYARLLQWAPKVARRFTDAAGLCDPDYACNVVTDVIGDTYEGRRPWDPDRRALAHHLRLAVQSRVANDLTRLRRHPHVSMHEDDEADATEITAAASLQVEDVATRPDEQVARRDLEARVRSVLGEGDDPDVAELLTAHQAGASRRDEVMARLGWSLPHYVNVRRRLATLLRRLPPELRDALGVVGVRRASIRGPDDEEQDSLTGDSRDMELAS